MTTTECACSQDRLPPLGEEGIAYFNAGEYYQQHDSFEALWKQTPGVERELYQGILQVGVAYYQITRGNWRGAVKMLARAARHLKDLPDSCQGVDVRQLREDAAHVRAALLALMPQTLDQFDRALLGGVRYLPRS
jgi:predicted metal-dependent hydrolase